MRVPAVALALCLMPELAGAAPAADWPALVERVAPAIVNVKLSLKTESSFGGEPEESTHEVLGAVVDPGGLILVWNSHFSPNRFLEIFGQGRGHEMQFKVTPTDIRVSFNGDPTEHAAFLAAADSDLDLAFIQLQQAPDAPLAAIDFSRAATPRLGDELAAVSRLTAVFDRVPYFDVVRITGQVRKPRTAWIVGAGNATQTGLPYFAADGRPAGVLVTVMSRTRTDTSLDGGNRMAELLGVGRGTVEVGPLGLFLLPADQVRPVIEQARLRAAELVAERAAAGDVAGSR